MATCTTIDCGGTGMISGIFEIDGDIPHRVTYCRECATYLWSDGTFTPDDETLLTDQAPPLKDWERALVEKFETAPPAPESFDAVAAVRRVKALAELWIAPSMGPLIRQAGHAVLDAIEGEK